MDDYMKDNSGLPVSLAILMLGAMIFVIIALVILYSNKLWRRLFPPKCDMCGKRGKVRGYYRDYDPNKPGSLEMEYLCAECEKKKEKAFMDQWWKVTKKRKKKENSKDK